MRELIDNKHRCFVPGEIVSSHVLEIVAPDPPVERYEDLPCLDGDRNVICEYLYVSLDPEDEVHESNIIMGRHAITPDLHEEFERALREGSNSDFVHLSALRKDFSLQQPPSLISIFPLKSMPRVYLGANPVFVMLNTGATIDEILKCDPKRNLQSELRARFQGTPDELLVDEIWSTLRVCQELYDCCFSDASMEQNIDAEDSPYLPDEHSAPSSDATQNSSPLRSKSGYPD
ncbi:hypothetical protein FISHEDRAFT_59024 [Fistulina hepatica ATCC 64428]|uniref:Uncharacterized protein n=1 Tax=Fistulina hepatica ATCC 64428 TaxID=1128425 RepID=A0A0D7ABH9_9AGAR|nr:hypothetical protein FISHEDRAFT_59024 [Fistulina hepatica ATCC 64428]